MGFEVWGLMAALVAGYFFGSIPFGLLLTRMVGLGDIRSIGSGNIGATNVLRTGNKGIAIATLLLDAAKGAVPVLAAAYFNPAYAPVAGLAAFIGHCYPIWLSFKGGKGVATFLGVIFALHYPVGFLCIASWLVVAALTRYSSLSALIMAVLTPAFFGLTGKPELIVLSSLLAILIIIRHNENIARLRSGSESKIGQKSE